MKVWIGLKCCRAINSSLANKYTTAKEHEEVKHTNFFVAEDKNKNTPYFWKLFKAFLPILSTLHSQDRMKERVFYCTAVLSTMHAETRMMEFASSLSKDVGAFGFCVLRCRHG